MSGCQHISVVDQCAAAVELIEIRQAHHPGEFVYASRLTTYYFCVDIWGSATCLFPQTQTTQLYLLLLKIERN